MAHRFEERDRYRGERGAREGHRYDQDDRHFESQRGQRRVHGGGSGSEYFGQGPALGEREPEPREYGRGQREFRDEDEYRDRGDGHGYGSGYGGHGDVPGEAGGSMDSGRSYSAEPGWGPGYGQMSGNQRGPRVYEGDRNRGAGYQDRSGRPWHGDMRQGSDRRYGGYGSHSAGHGEPSHGDATNPWGQPRGGKPQWRGPKGYQRSDERLKEDISERLMSMGHYVDASDVSIDVKDGKVSLEGSVPERRMKHAIEDVVDECMGVKDIDNRIRVGAPHHGSDQAGAIGSGNASLSIGGGSQSSVSGMSGGTGGTQT